MIQDQDKLRSESRAMRRKKGLEMLERIKRLEGRMGRLRRMGMGGWMSEARFSLTIRSFEKRVNLDKV